MTHAAGGGRTYSDVAGWKRCRNVCFSFKLCLARHKEQFSRRLAAGLFIKNVIVGIIDLDRTHKLVLLKKKGSDLSQDPYAHTLFLLHVALGPGKPSKKKANVCNSTSLEALCHQPSPPQPGGWFYSSGRKGSCCRSCVNITLPFQPGLFVFFHAVHHTPTRRSACALIAAPATFKRDARPDYRPKKPQKTTTKKGNRGPLRQTRGYSGILLKSGLWGMCERGLSDQELIKAFTH